MKIICENCGEPGYMKLCYVKRWKHHFCCRACYLEYRRKHQEQYVTKEPKNMKGQHKLKKLAELYKKKREGTHEHQPVAD